MKGGCQMKIVRRLAIAVITMLPIVAMATSVGAQAWGNTLWGFYQPEFPKN